jgi:nucleotide-binding universal stress UspA family protein
MEIRRILCPTDFSPVSERGIELAAQVASRFHAQLTLQHNLDPLSPMYIASVEMLPQSIVDLEQEREDQAEERLKEILSGLRPELAPQGRITSGQPHAAILSLARSLPADLIVMGTHGRSGLGHLFVGSVTERVVGQAPCPVLTLRDSEQLAAFRPLTTGSDIQPVLVPIDFSAHSIHTFEYALQTFARLPVALTLLHVVEPVTSHDLRSATHFNVPEFLQMRVHEARERLEGLIPANVDRPVRVEVRLGSAIEEIPRCARDSDARFVVMGSHHKGIVDQFIFGATSKAVLRTSPCPVWIVPAIEVAHAIEAEIAVPASR